MQTEPAIFVVALSLSLALTALVRELAPRIGLTDQPDGHRKLHTAPTPLGGGLAVFLTFAVVMAGLALVPNPFQERLWSNWHILSAILLAGALMVAVGLWDDKVGMRGRTKLLWQAAGAAILIAAGLLIREVTVLGYTVRLGLLAYPITMFWFLGAMNALNLLDGIDGLATMLGIILSFTIAVLAILTGQPGVAIIAMVFSASLLGFMWFNFPPATIFLGDAGSMLIGLVVSAAAIMGSLKGAGTVLLVAPLAVWAVPIFDSAAAILRRKLTGRSIYATDRGHLHHRLFDLLGDNRKVLAVIALCCAATSIAALVSVGLANDLIALVTCAAVAGILVATGVFGRVELLLLGSRLRRASRAFIPPIGVGHAGARQSIVRLHGSGQWESLWRMLTDAAADLDVCEIQLDLSLPALREGYHASWESGNRSEAEHRWRVELPLCNGDTPIGRLRVAGLRRDERAGQTFESILALFDRFEDEMQLLLPRPEPEAEPEPAEVLALPDAEPEPAALAAALKAALPRQPR